jgi:hypothetical protein
MSYATIRCDTSQYYTPQEAAIQYALKQYVAMQYAIRMIFYSDCQLPLGNEAGADSGEAPNGLQLGSWPLDILV